MIKIKNWFELNQKYKFEVTDLTTLIYVLCTILGIIGIVFSVIGKNRYGDWNGVSIGGLVTSIVGLVITGAQLIFVIYALGIAARIVVS